MGFVEFWNSGVDGLYSWWGNTVFAWKLTIVIGVIATLAFLWWVYENR